MTEDTTPQDYISTEQRNAFSWAEQGILDHISKQGVVLIKIDPLEPEPDFLTGGYLVSYKVRGNEIMMFKLPRAKDRLETFRFLALHMEAESMRLP